MTKTEENHRRGQHEKDTCNSTIAAYAAFLRTSFRLLCRKTQPDTPDTETVWETVSEAYIYAFPLVLTDATKTLSTNTDGTMTGRAPLNQFNHAQSWRMPLSAPL